MTDQRDLTRHDNIAVLLHDLRGGGAERVMLNLAKGMADAGRKVTLLLVDARGDYLDLVPDNIAVVNLGKANVFKAVPAVAAYLKSSQPKAILSALPHVNVALLLASLVARPKSKIVLTEHNQITLKADGARGLRRRLTYFLIPWLYRFADAVIAVSNGVARDIESYAKLPRNSVKCVNNPSYSPAIVTRSMEEPTHPWFHDGGPDILLAAGRLHKQKAYNVLLRAMALVRHHRNVRLLIIGEGGERSTLEALRDELNLNDCVDFAGFCPNPYSFMARSKLLVMSSAWEGLPTVLIEGMACDLPIVSTDCPSGPREILDEGRFGCLVPVGDPLALAEGILEGLDHPKRGGPDRAALYSVDIAASRYLEILEA